MECELTLQTNLTENLVLSLTETVESNILKKSNICGIVYSDMKYSATINFHKKEVNIKSIKFYINDTLRECTYINGKIFFNDKNYLDNRIFLNYFGYTTITIQIETIDKNYFLYSNYLDVAIRDTVSSDIVREMIKYISTYSQKYLFKENTDIKDFCSIKESKYKNTETEISLLEEILIAYENNYKYFKTSSKYTINSNYIVDDFNKLREIKNETIQYIISNPQHLISVNHSTGFKHNKLHLQPRKTLINKNGIIYDIYENRIVLGFLKHIYHCILKKIEYIDNQIDNNQNYFILSGYVSSSNEIHKEAYNKLYKYKTQLYVINKKIQKFYFMYKQILKCNEINVISIPKPTAIFMNIAHYRKIYKIIKDWFDGGNYDFQTEKLILTFSEASQIYECYLLFKINNYISGKKYSLINSNKFTYKLSKHSKYKNTNFENTFSFKKEKTNITVYYQPVIYLNHIANDINLFRNNDISLENGRSQYYTPDYVIKVTRDEMSKFIILDAKWSNLNSVINYSFNEIIYKYFFSISTINNLDKIDKVWVINGKEIQNQKDYIYNYYNSKFKERTNELTPSVKIITLNPNVDKEVQEESLNRLFSTTISSFRKINKEI